MQHVVEQRLFGEAPLLIFADHASNFVPEDLYDLGLPEDVLATHIAWDIGAKSLAIRVAERLQARLLCCGFSRLVIDANRDPSVMDSIPATSDQIPVPGNQMLSEQDRQSRLDRYFSPYHDALGEAVTEVAAHERGFAVSIHSFTKRMMGASQDRPWDVGLLWSDDPESAQTAIDWLRDNSPWQIGDNEPYDARVFNYSVDRHIGPIGLRHLTFEVRQDHLANEQEIESVAELLCKTIEHTMRE